jgi:hypothetical protein
MASNASSSETPNEHRTLHSRNDKQCSVLAPLPTSTVVHHHHHHPGTKPTHGLLGVWPANVPHSSESLSLRPSLYPTPTLLRLPNSRTCVASIGGSSIIHFLVVGPSVSRPRRGTLPQRAARMFKMHPDGDRANQPLPNLLLLLLPPTQPTRHKQHSPSIFTSPRSINAVRKTPN